MNRLVIASVILGWTAVATATPAEDARHEFERGQAAYTARNYLEAATRFEAAYRLDPNPGYLFNIAQAYRLGRACRQAVTFYQKFFAAVPDPPNAIELKQYQSEAETCAIDHEAKTRRIDRGGTKRLAGAVLTGIGAIGVGVGIGFSYHARSLERQHIALCPPTEDCAWDDTKTAQAADLDHQGKIANIGLTVSYSVGAAALISGAVLYFLGRADHEDRIIITPLDHGGVVTGQLSF